MAKDKEKKPSPPPSTKKISEDDLDKTTLDIDIRQLEGFEETVMVKVPPPDDSDLHEIEFFDQEKTGEHEVEVPPAASASVPDMEATGFFQMPGHEEEEAPPPPPPPKVKAKPAAPVQKPPPPAPEPLRTSPAVSETAKPKRSLLYLVLSLVFFLFLAEGLVEVLSRGAGLRGAAILATALALLFFVGALLRRLEGRTAFLGIVLAWFSLVAWAGFRFYASDPANLHFFKIGLATWMGPFWVLVLAVVTAVLFSTPRLAFLAKLLAGISLLLGLVALVFALIAGKTFEAGIWGPSYLSALPLWLRPGVLSLALSFPLMVLAILLGWLLHRKTGEPLLRRGVWALLVISLIGSMLGFKLLSRQGMKPPGTAFLTKENFYGVTWLDPLTTPIKFRVSEGQAIFNSPEGMPLRVAAARSSPAGKGRQTRLMVRNQEGLSFAPGVAGHLVLSRGDKAIRGVQVDVDAARLGATRDLLLILDLPSLIQTDVKSSMVSAIYEAASLLQSQDRLHLASAAAGETLAAGKPGSWEKSVEKALAPANTALDMTVAMKKLAGAKGLKQAIWIGDAAKLPPAETRAAWQAEAKKHSTVLSFVTLGAVSEAGSEVYASLAPAGLGFEILSAAAETWGDATLKFPTLAPLPRLRWAKDETGQALVKAGKVEFEIQAQDPSIIQSLTVQLDGEKPLTLDKGALQQSVDLAAMKIRPGPHRLNLSLTTSEGDVVSEGLDLQYVARRPLRFVKPLDKDSVSGNFNVMLAGGQAQGLTIQSLELSIDGQKIGQATSEPYLIPFNTTTLSEGPHTLQAVQTYGDGSSETQQIQVNVNQQTPTLQILRPSNGEYLSNLGDIEAQVGGGLFEQVQKVEFLVDGEWIGESLQAPYRFLWSNSAYPAGNYFIQARASLANQATVTDAVAVQLGQGEIVVQADPSLSPTGTLFPDNVEVLLDASARMNQPVGQAFKIDLAKAAMSGLLQTLPQNSRLNAKVFGSQSMADQQDCSDVKAMKTGSGAWDTLQARGVFPLNRGLEMLEKDIKKSQGSRVGLLIAGGWDQCGGDPIAVATRIAKQGSRIRLHVIYFSDVDPTAESLLKRLAEVMGGRTYKVARQEDLQRAIADAVQVNFSLYDFKNTAVVDLPLSQKALPVRAGEYRLEVDTSPQVVKPQVQVSVGGRKTLSVQSVDGKYDIREE
jgi:hypothetical protein